MKKGKKAAGFRRTRSRLNAPGIDAAGESATPDERVHRLYGGDGGPLIQWLLDEARRRRMDLSQMAREVGVTYGYIAQLRAGIRKTSTMSHDFARACAEFLGIPAVLVFLLAGSITIRDFATRALSEQELAERAVRQMRADPHLRATLPVNFEQLNAEGKRALALLYADTSGQDVFGVRQLPEIVRWLKRAAEIHDENEFAAATGHRDTVARAA